MRIRYCHGRAHAILAHVYALFEGERPEELAGCETEVTLGPAGGDGIGFGRVATNTS